jgi:hypothetical protein
MQTDREPVCGIADCVAGRRTRRRAQLCDMVLVSFLCLAAAIPACAQAPPSVEYQVKAAFLLNFVKFIEWPSEAFQNKQAPVTLRVFGHDPFGSALDDILRGRTVNNRAVVVRRINSFSSALRKSTIKVVRGEIKMRLYRDLTIRQKLQGIVMASCGVALVVASVAITFYDQTPFLHAKREDLVASAKMIGSNSTAALTFHAARSAREVLSALQAKPQIRIACIYDSEGFEENGVVVQMRKSAGEPKMKKTCIHIVLLNITYAGGRFHVRDQRSIHGCSAYHGSSWFLSRPGNPFGYPR